jgi:hypothetical protein
MAAALAAILAVAPVVLSNRVAKARAAVLKFRFSGRRDRPH